MLLQRAIQDLSACRVGAVLAHWWGLLGWLCAALPNASQSCPRRGACLQHGVGRPRCFLQAAQPSHQAAWHLCVHPRLLPRPRELVLPKPRLPGVHRRAQRLERLPNHAATACQTWHACVLAARVPAQLLSSPTHRCARPAYPPCSAGLPEEVAHTKQCLARGYAVLALASKDRTRMRCFSAAGDQTLSERVRPPAAAAAAAAGALPAAGTAAACATHAYAASHRSSGHATPHLACTCWTAHLAHLPGLQATWSMPWTPSSRSPRSCASRRSRSTCGASPQAPASPSSSRSPCPSTASSAVGGPARGGWYPTPAVHAGVPSNPRTLPTCCLNEK